MVYNLRTSLIFQKLGNVPNKTHEFLGRGLQLTYKFDFFSNSETSLKKKLGRNLQETQETCKKLARNLQETCKKLVKFCTKLHTQEYPCINRNDPVPLRSEFQIESCKKLARNLQTTCMELVAKFDKFCTKLHTQQISADKK